MSFFFFFNDTATTEIYTLSLHDALPIFKTFRDGGQILKFALSSFAAHYPVPVFAAAAAVSLADRKSTRLNSSHSQISYAVFCLKKKKQHGFRAALVCDDDDTHNAEHGPV